MFYYYICVAYIYYKIIKIVLNLDTPREHHTLPSEGETILFHSFCRILLSRMISPSPLIIRLVSLNQTAPNTSLILKGVQSYTVIYPLLLSILLESHLFHMYLFSSHICRL